MAGALAAGMLLGHMLFPGHSCSTPTAPAGTTISVNAAGNASAPYNGTGYGMVCSPNGQWLPIAGR